MDWFVRAFLKASLAWFGAGVLLGLSMAVFPRGVKSPLLDTLARAPIWSAGIDYGHGTGHGVGFDLSGTLGTINIANAAGSTLTIDGASTGIRLNGVTSGTVNVANRRPGAERNAAASLEGHQCLGHQEAQTMFLVGEGREQHAGTSADRRSRADRATQHRLDDFGVEMLLVDLDLAARPVRHHAGPLQAPAQSQPLQFRGHALKVDGDEIARDAIDRVAKALAHAHLDRPEALRKIAHRCGAEFLIRKSQHAVVPQRLQCLRNALRGSQFGMVALPVIHAQCITGEALRLGYCQHRCGIHPARQEHNCIFHVQ
mgnify:CR=1 FL=1